MSTARRAKHEVLTRAGRVARDEDNQLLPILELIGSEIDTEREVIGREALTGIRDRIQCLSPLEREALRVVVNGIAYRGDKRMDNAIQRMRKKLAEAA